MFLGLEMYTVNNLRDFSFLFLKQVYPLAVNSVLGLTRQPKYIFFMQSLHQAIYILNSNLKTIPNQSTSTAISLPSTVFKVSVPKHSHSYREATLI